MFLSNRVDQDKILYMSYTLESIMVVSSGTFIIFEVINQKFWCIPIITGGPR